MPTRKPIAVLSALFVSIVVLWHTVNGSDVPQGVAGILEALLTVCVGSYAATSAYESVRSPEPESVVRSRYQRDDNDEGEKEY